MSKKKRKPILYGPKSRWAPKGIPLQPGSFGYRIQELPQEKRAAFIDEWYDDEMAACEAALIEIRRELDDLNEEVLPHADHEDFLRRRRNLRARLERARRNRQDIEPHRLMMKQDWGLA